MIQHLKVLRSRVFLVVLAGACGFGINQAFADPKNTETTECYDCVCEIECQKAGHYGGSCEFDGCHCLF